MISDLVDQDGFKRIGSAQLRKKGAFLQHGEIQTNPSKDLWFKLFREEAPPKINPVSYTHLTLPTIDRV